MKRAIVIVLDGVGAGALPDAADYGDEGCNTLAGAARGAGALNAPNLQAWGLGNVCPIPGVPPTADPSAWWGIMAERSPAKDSISGHWELAGVIRKQPPMLYPDGFPPAVIERFRALTGMNVLGNVPASGTEIIRRLGGEHLRTGAPIVYTSADSVFQVAAHKRVIPLEELYRLCRVVRDEIMNGKPYNVDRVIARPFDGGRGAFRRTAERRDFAIPPPEPTVLETARREGVRVTGVGKVDDLFAGRGFDEVRRTASNSEGMRTLIALVEQPPARSGTLILMNLLDFDQEYGHRRDARGFRAALEEFDAFVPALTRRLRGGDLVIITADHGCDPAARGTDHTREYVPLLACLAGMERGGSLGVRATFADAGAAVAEFLGVPPPPAGRSFLRDVGNPRHEPSG
ncbi:MAG: phosphopentomutase [bacterium]